jgi:hypothetical protein
MDPPLPPFLGRAGRDDGAEPDTRGPLTCGFGGSLRLTRGRDRPYHGGTTPRGQEKGARSRVSF